MRELLTEEKLLIDILSKRWVIKLYDIYKSQAISIAQIAQFVKNYREDGCILLVKHHIIKTPKGFFYFKRIAKTLFMSSNNSWKQPSDKYFHTPFAQNEPYTKSNFKSFQ